MNSTPLSFMIDVMDQQRDFANVEQQYKVRAIDTALRQFRMKTNFPWNLKKGTLKVFDGVSEYPVTADHDEIGYVDKQNIKSYSDTARFYNTSLQQFYEIVNSGRNLMADIWKDGTRFIGLNVDNMGLNSAELSNAEVAGDYTASDDASDIEVDNIVYKEGNGSIKFTVTDSAGIATIENTTGIGSDTDYKTKYQFRWIYLGAVPTSIELRLQTDATNYLSTVVTTQFAGNAFVAGDWNLIAQDLNEATETGTFDKTAVNSEKMILNGSPTATNRIDTSSLKQWKLLDKWYYSKYNVIDSLGVIPSREYFIPVDGDTSDIDLTDSLLGDSKWIDVIVGRAMRTLLADIENPTLLSWVREFRKEAETEFYRDYPSMTPLIITQRRRFDNDPMYAFGRSNN